MFLFHQSDIYIIREKWKIVVFFTRFEKTLKNWRFSPRKSKNLEKKSEKNRKKIETHSHPIRTIETPCVDFSHENTRSLSRFRCQNGHFCCKNYAFSMGQNRPQLFFPSREKTLKKNANSEISKLDLSLKLQKTPVFQNWENFTHSEWDIYEMWKQKKYRSSDGTP